MSTPTDPDADGQQSEQVAPPAHGTDSDIELKARSRWPLVTGLVVVAALLVVGAFFVINRGDANAGQDKFGTTLKVSFTDSDQAQQAFLEHIAKEIAPDYGITIVPTGLGDYNQLSQTLNDGDIAGTVYAHRPWIEQTNAANGWKLTPVAPVFQWTYSVYSSRYQDLDAIPDGAEIAILDDPANTAQALILLADADFVTLDPDVDPTRSTLSDIVDNPKNIKITQIAFGAGPRSLDEFDAIVGYNYEFNGAGTPASKRIYSPAAPKAFAAHLTVATATQDEPNIKKLIEVFADERINEYLTSTDDPRVKGQIAVVGVTE